ncbi:MAG: hypothetical protein H7287_14585, partial [Thermoleophilia bacterium]|nr:hypothetical protein [Thermoleophilia bacterium]
FILLAALVLGAGGYLWWMKMYKPAVAARATAITASQSSQQALQQAQSEQKSAQAQVDALKSASSKADESVARVTLLRSAIPDKSNLGDAAIVLKHLADRSGIQTNLSVGSDAETQAAVASGTGPTPTDVTFKAAGTYAEMTNFLRQAQSTVTVDKNKLHVTGRLFNVVKLTIGTEDAATSSSAVDSGGSSSSTTGAIDAALSDEFVLGLHDKLFTIVVRFYTLPAGGATNTGALAPTIDPNAANGAAPTSGAAPGTSSDGTSTGTASSDTSTANNTGSPGATGATDTTGASPGGATNTTGGQAS